MHRWVQAMAGVEVGAVEIAEAGIATRVRSGPSDPANDWLCAWCLNRVASEKDRFHWQGQSEFAFANPAGIRFNLLTFWRTTGCRQTGIPTLDCRRGQIFAFCICLNPEERRALLCSRSGLHPLLSL